MSAADDDLRTGLSILLENFPSEVTLPKRGRRETVMHMAMRLDPDFKPTASTLRARERQAGQRLIELYAERDAAITSPPSDSRNKLLIHRLKSAKPSKIKDA